jgi:hypothetical protein
MGRYPMDEIKAKSHCELCQSMKNISMKVAVGYALPIEHGVTWYSHQISDGYARVGVDEVLCGYESLDLDIAGPEDEATLREMLNGVVLWKKKDIKFPGLILLPPPSRRRSPSPPSPPSDYDDHHYASPSRSPPSGQPSSPPLAPTKPSVPLLAPTKPSAPPLAPTKLQGQKRKKRTTTSGTQSSGTREEPLQKKTLWRLSIGLRA